MFIKNPNHIIMSKATKIVLGTVFVTTVVTLGIVGYLTI